MYYGLRRILFGLELVERKDHQSEIESLDYDSLGRKIGGLLVHSCSLCFGTERCVVIDSGFCVSKA